MDNILIQAIFYIFAALAVIAAFLVVTQNNPVRCVLFLVLTFFASAVLWLLQEAEFLALILVLVYVGAVMTLFLFVVMMLNIDVESMKGHFARYLPFGLILVALLVGLLMIATPPGTFKPVQSAVVSQQHQVTEGDPMEIKKLSNTEQIGMLLYTDYILAFEIAAVLLLVAIISAITLAHRGIIRSKRQNILKQLTTRRDDRITLVNIKPGK